MTARAAAIIKTGLPDLRTAAGEPPRGAGGEAFGADQGEMFEHWSEAYRTLSTRIGVLELEGGKWLAFPFGVDRPQYASRADALRAGIAQMVRKARRYMRTGEGQGTHWSEGYGGRVIEWALSLKPPVKNARGNKSEHLEKKANSDLPERPILSAKGRAPTGAGDRWFFPGGDDGEWHIPEDDRLRGIDAQIGLIELNTGRWLAHPQGCCVDYPSFPTRETALRSAIAKLIRHQRMLVRDRAKLGFMIGVQPEKGRAVIEWALSLNPGRRRAPVAGQHPIPRDTLSGNGAAQSGTPAAPRSLSDVEFDKIARRLETESLRPVKAHYTTPPAAERDYWIHGDDDAVQLICDPIVRRLVEEHRQRKAFPAKHTFSMTNPIEDGRILILATCTCGHVVKFGSGDQLRVDAAIEAHWRRHGHEPEVDGRGIPIKPGDGSRIPRLSRAEARALKTQAEERAAGVPEDQLTPLPKSFGAKAINAEERAAASPKPPPKARKRGQRSAPEAGEEREFANAALPALEALSAEGAGSPFISHGAGGAPFAEAASGNAPRPEPAPMSPGAGSPSSNSAALRGVSPLEPAPSGAPTDGAGAVPSEAAPIGAGSEDDDILIEWPSYDDYLDAKIVTAPLRGIEVDRAALHPWLKPHCKDLVVWGLRLGCAAIFASFGLHKTAMQLEWCRQLQQRVGGATLTVVPLGVRHGFIGEAVNLGMELCFVRTTAEFDQAISRQEVVHFLTNYESIRDGKLDPNRFSAVTLDEASVLRSYGSKTFQEFLPLFERVPFKLVATATPSPNRYKELIHYAGFLGVMDTGLALTRWFQRNSEKAGDLTLYPHKEEEFWMWVHSWAAFLQKPSELGHSDEGYELPPLKLNWHEVPADHSKAEPDRDGQGVMFRAVASSLSEAAKSRRDSLAPRVAKMLEIIAQDPDAQRIIWHDLEAEREAIEAALPGVVTITGSGMDIDTREVRLHDFEQGRIRHFATKPILSGSGSNFQYHCHKAVYLALPGYGYKFNDFIQSLYRLQRFGQQHPVEVDIIYSEDERAGRAALEEKWARDTEMRVRMSEIIRQHGLDTLPLRDRLARSIGIKRVEIRGERFVAINNDAVAEARTWPENSVDQIVTSIPFANHYEYSASYNDFGHTDDNGHFWGQMDFLTAENVRMLKPGRLACIHVKDRVLFGSVTGEGVPTISPFHAEAIMHYRAHGLQYMGMITVVTDVVRENNGTYRLGWSENGKDSTKMGVGQPEYVLLLRKPQSDRTRGYADVPVEKSKDDYTRARWQIDAHSFWRSNGNRLLTPEEFAWCSSADLAKIFAKATVDRVYDYEAHVQIGEVLERAGTLPATFMAIAPGSHHPDVWHDVNRMRTLNMLQERKGAEKHICPLQFDIVDRLIERYSNEGDLIYDPFGGLGTVPYRALLKGRRGAMTELNATYFLDAVHYCRSAEENVTTPQLFDLAAFDAANTPPPGLSGD